MKTKKREEKKNANQFCFTTSVLVFVQSPKRKHLTSFLYTCHQSIMDSETPTKRINEKQKEFLVDFMEKNYKFLFGKFATGSGKGSKDEKWVSLSSELNALGPPNKDVSGWKKVYRIHKFFSILNFIL